LRSFDNDSVRRILGLRQQQLWFRQFGQFRLIPDLDSIFVITTSNSGRAAALRENGPLRNGEWRRSWCFDNFSPGQTCRFIRDLLGFEFLARRVIMPVVGIDGDIENNSLPGWE